MFIESLQSAITTATAITSLIGTSGTRADSTNGVFPTQAPDQPAVPYIVVSQVSGESLATHFQGTDALTTERWRLSCHGSTYKQAKQLAKAVRLFLLSLDGTQTTGKSEVHGAWCVMEADDSESLGKGTLFGTHVDFDFTYQDLDT